MSAGTLHKTKPCDEQVGAEEGNAKGRTYQRLPGANDSQQGNAHQTAHHDQGSEHQARSLVRGQQALGRPPRPGLGLVHVHNHVVQHGEPVSTAVGPLL